MSDTDIIEVLGRKYKFGKPNAIAQFHIARKLAPMLAMIAASEVSLTKDGVLDVSALNMALVKGVSEYLPSLSDGQANDIIYSCLQYVFPLVDTTISPYPVVTMIAGNKLVMQDESLTVVDLFKLMEIMIGRTLAPFSKGTTSISEEQKMETSQPTAS